MARYKLNSQQKDDIVKEYVSSFISASRLAKRYCVNPSSVYTLLRRRGVNTRDNRKHFPEGTTEAIVCGYKAGVSSKELAKKLGVNDDWILAFLRSQDVTIRTKSQAHRLTYKLDEQCFDDINCEEKAYFLGFLLADGCVTDKNQISLAAACRDIDIIRKFKAFTKSSNSIMTDKKTDSYKIAFSSKHMSDALKRYGVVPRKSLIAEVPKELDHDLLPHFWRGVLDGDGFITSCGNDNKTIGLCGSRHVIESFAAYCRTISSTVRIHPKIRPHKNIFNVVICGQAAYEILGILYGNATVFLDRKYEIYKKIILNHERRLAARSSRFIGVSLYKNKQYVARCGYKHIGIFQTEQEAALFRDRYILDNALNYQLNCTTRMT